MQMMRSKCKKCDWVFDVATAPMPVTEWCNVMQGACCPMCANNVGNTLAPPRTLTDAEASHKRLLVALPSESAA